VVKTSNVSMKDYFANKLAQKGKKVTKFQTASGEGFSLDMQADYYNRMLDMSYQGARGLGFGRASDEGKGRDGDEKGVRKDKEVLVEKENQMAADSTAKISSKKKKKSKEQSNGVEIHTTNASQKISSKRKKSKEQSNGVETNKKKKIKTPNWC